MKQKNHKFIIILVLSLSLIYCESERHSKINKDFILEIGGSELKDFDSINDLLKNNKEVLLRKLQNDRNLQSRKDTYFYFTKILLNKYIPDSTTNRGFLNRHNFSYDPQSKVEQERKPKLNLAHLNFNFEKNKAVYYLWNSKTLKGERSSTYPEKNYNYKIGQKLLYNAGLDSIKKSTNNLLYVKKINDNWIYIIDYNKIGNDEYYKTTLKETDSLKREYFNF